MMEPVVESIDMLYFGCHSAAMRVVQPLNRRETRYFSSFRAPHIFADSQNCAFQFYFFAAECSTGAAIFRISFDINPNVKLLFEIIIGWKVRNPVLI